MSVFQVTKKWLYNPQYNGLFPNGRNLLISATIVGDAPNVIVNTCIIVMNEHNFCAF